LRILCLDLGDVRVGVAISDELNIIASPLTVIDLKKADLIKELQKIIDVYNVKRIIVGYPLQKTNPELKNERLKRVDTIIDDIRKRFDIEVVKWDERFSTKAVDRILSYDLNWKKKKKVIDKMAATYILQGYLDYFNNSKP